MNCTVPFITLNNDIISQNGNYSASDFACEARQWMFVGDSEGWRGDAGHYVECATQPNLLLLRFDTGAVNLTCYKNTTCLHESLIGKKDFRLSHTKVKNV